MRLSEFTQPKKQPNDTIPAQTPRNFVAKNMKSSGAGTHADKKRDSKRGVEKHKKDFKSLAESDTNQDTIK